jgi:PAS domain S-box-containing protein
MEKESRDMLTFLKTLIDAIPSPIFYQDISGLYLGCNRAFEEFLGLKKEKLVGKSVYDVFPKIWLKNITQWIRYWLIKGGNRHMRIRSLMPTEKRTMSSSSKLPT